ncbi:LacI family DNA-binding transcriptional regulator [Fibrivirga algicola]|uniref:LacI family transcriptional regulator n=1 Tax=Fibrivirga algicola TaxID=2950420 RepID=A0ABX0QC67_9BACT|nr:LacI family DNA-binding transcriptional regulator [Fibrivirga algicola]ARK10783.1 LacI family transcriptional regulator [Fibrella sp. ES10-3-2-2]NID09986.1 LacI family transcriptional regulator [Fibrivirga algicola]
MEKEVTIYDIAKRLNYSPATVSRALNDHPAIKINTKDIITSMAREMGYRSNTFASNLRRQRTNTIGVIVPRLNSNFVSCVLAGMEKVANEAGYNLIITQSLESVTKEKANAQTMFNSRVDGLLVSVAYDTEDIEHFSSFINKGIPLLFFDRVIATDQSTSIVIDNAKAGYEATVHLLKLGRQRIMHVTGNLKRNVYADRLKGYRQALEDYNLPFDERLVLVTDLSQEVGVQVAKQICKMQERPDGLFITNDLCAVSCMTTLKQAGLSIPDDIAIVGFNDDPVSQVIEPALTTIHYPGREMGEVAAKSLINHLNGLMDIQATNTIILRSELIVRGSSQKQPK